MESYTLLLKADNIPEPGDNVRKNEIHKNLKDSFWKQFNEFENDLDGFIVECHELFDESFGVFNYNILIFEKEIDLIIALFDIVKASDNDYVEIWNAPYDMQNLIERPKVLGYDPSTIIVDEAFGKRSVSYKEDRNVFAHKRRHVCETYSMMTYVDQMVNYAGIRSGRGTLPSLKLNSIARAELRDEKIDYSEEGNIKYFPYKSWRKFVLYNIKDVLIQYGISQKTKDMDTFYTTIYRNAVLPNQVFTSTSIISESFRKYIYTFGEGYVMGSNKSRIFGRDTGMDYAGLVHAAFNQYNDDDEYDPDDLFFDDDDEGDGKTDKFKGAFVMNPKYMTSTGYEIMGKVAQFIHEHVVDFDITSEYPTAILIMNASNETMVGKVFLEDPDSIDIKFYPGFVFVDKDEEEKYIMNPGDFLLEVYSQNDVLNFGEIFLKLPPIDSVIGLVNENITSLLK